MRDFGQAGHAGDYEPLSLEEMRERYAAGATGLGQRVDADSQSSTDSTTTAGR